MRRLFFTGLVVLTISGLWLAWQLGRTSTSDTASLEAIATGRTLYALHCVSCHGAQLEGQPDWRTPLPTGRLPAPPHDAGGHTWHHSDDLLFQIVKEGTAAVVGGGYESDMPGFGNILNDAEILTLLDFIKSTWPERERLYQADMSRMDRATEELE